MAILEEVAGGQAATGLAVGIVAAIMAPVLLPAIVGVGRPLLKGAIKGGMMFYERGQEMAAELGETFEDLVAEAKSEMQTEENDLKGAEASASGDTTAVTGQKRRRARRKSS